MCLLSDQYRPYVGRPFQRVALSLAGKLNESALLEFDDLQVIRLALAELWKRAFPGQPLPDDAARLLRPYHTDPELYNPLKT